MSHPDNTARQLPTWNSLPGPDLRDLQDQLDQLKQQVRVLQVAVLALQASSPAPVQTGLAEREERPLSPEGRIPEVPAAILPHEPVTRSPAFHQNVEASMT